MTVEIKWINYGKNSYTFGSQITFLGDRVQFENPLMSPSFSLTSWSSMLNFQANRQQPALPLLHRGKSYHMELVAEVIPLGTVYLKITYFNRFGEEIGFDTLKEPQWEFTYPLEAFHYTVDLVNAGCERVVFDRILLSEVNQDPGYDVRMDDLAVYAPVDNNRIHVLFLEPDVYRTEDLPLEELATLGNLVLVGDKEAAKSCYLHKDFEESLKRRLYFYRDNGLTDVCFIGYGPIGNLASLYYSSQFESQAYITEQLYPYSFYRKLIYLSDGERIQSVNRLLERSLYAQNVHHYGNWREPKELQLVSELFDTTNQLKMLPLLTGEE